MSCLPLQHSSVRLSHIATSRYFVGGSGWGDREWRAQVRVGPPYHPQSCTQISPNPRLLARIQKVVCLLRREQFRICLYSVGRACGRCLSASMPRLMLSDDMRG